MVALRARERYSCPPACTNAGPLTRFARYGPPSLSEQPQWTRRQQQGRQRHAPGNSGLSHRQRLAETPTSLRRCRWPTSTSPPSVNGPATPAMPSTSSTHGRLLATVRSRRPRQQPVSTPSNESRVSATDGRNATSDALDGVRRALRCDPHDVPHTAAPARALRLVRLHSSEIASIGPSVEIGKGKG